MRILVLNCGSSTVKHRSFGWDGARLVEEERGLCEVSGSHGAAVADLLRGLPFPPDLVAHRVVHGGARFVKPTLIDAATVEELAALSALAPLHNPPAVEGIRAGLALGVPQVAVFDTAFHATLPEEAWRYALPLELADRLGLRRWGFHGISHEGVMRRCAALLNDPAPTLVSLHLGAGASVAAIKDGRCVDASMGLTPLEGLVMVTRPGDLDPALPLRLLRSGMNLDEVDDLLWRGSGLKGLAGEADMRRLLMRDDAAARLAVAMFCRRATKYIGAYMAVLGGARALAFTGGIGENAPEVRARILAPLAFMGAALDPAANGANAERVSAPEAPLAIFVIPANEERSIAKLALQCLS